MVRYSQLTINPQTSSCSNAVTNGYAPPVRPTMKKSCSKGSRVGRFNCKSYFRGPALDLQLLFKTLDGVEIDLFIGLGEVRREENVRSTARESVN